MIPTWAEPYEDGELRGGWASWDDGSLKDRSIKYAYPDKSGKISRGCPELPFGILVDMVVCAHARGELAAEQVGKIATAIGVNSTAGSPPGHEQDSVSTYHNPGSTVRVTVGPEGTTFTLAGHLSQDDADLARNMFEASLRRRVAQGLRSD